MTVKDLFFNIDSNVDFNKLTKHAKIIILCFCKKGCDPCIRSNNEISKKLEKGTKFFRSKSFDGSYDVLKDKGVLIYIDSESKDRKSKDLMNRYDIDCYPTYINHVAEKEIELEDLLKLF